MEPFVSAVRNPLESFELDDTHIYTRDVVVMQVIDDILTEFDGELPVVPNAMDGGVAADAAALLSIFPNVLVVSIGAVHNVSPVNRRIDFDLPPLALIMFSEDADRLPLSANGCPVTELEAITAILDTPEAPLGCCAFPLGDVRPLAVLEAPVDPEEDLARLANLLVALILATDIVPFVPVMGELEPDEVCGVLDGLIDDDTLSEDAIGKIVPRLRVGRVGGVSGPVKDVPHLVRPEDLVARLLWRFLLPQIPVRRAEFDELIAAAVDDLDIEPAELDSEEPLPEEVEQLLRLYSGRSTH
jgi:hypothetical protein